MFTGLIGEIGIISALEARPDGAELRIATALAGEIEPGDSVCVSGVCLTASEVAAESFRAQAMNETLKVSALDQLRRGDRVNLELALRAGDRLGGHLVQGHVDGTGEVLSLEGDGFARRLRVAAEPGLLRFVIERGSIALDGVSLTVSALGQGWLEVALVPETLERTTLGELTPGRIVNLECDVLGKYVERLVQPFAASASR